MVQEPGQVAALNAGLTASLGDIVAITDDDTIPRPRWLEHMERIFKTIPGAGGVGGRDWVHRNGLVDHSVKKTVGKIQWFGRVIGNHHLGSGAPREVDVLKGANMGYRRAAVQGLSFNGTLKGAGAQVHNDLAFSMAVRRNGWKLIYDPEVAVDHYPAARYEDPRNTFNSASIYDIAYNETRILLEYLGGARRLAYLIWAIGVGTSTVPGVANYVRLMLVNRRHATPKYSASIRGRLDAMRE
jgi:cellulose synthase/poly-beta-1,6-N-acetylglucosamine synthase-like glycosyltransferase